MTSLILIRNVFALDSLQKRRFLEQSETQNLQNSVQAQIDLEFLFDNRDQDVGANGNPDLRLHGIVGRTTKGFDS